MSYLVISINYISISRYIILTSSSYSLLSVCYFRVINESVKLSKFTLGSEQDQTCLFSASKKSKIREQGIME